MQIVIIGGGSVGLLQAARLALGSNQVQLITRSTEQAERIQQDFVTIQTLEGTQVKVPVVATAFKERLPEADLYLVTVKQPDLQFLLSALQKIPSTARVIAFQNGLGHHEILANILDSKNMFYAVNTEGARRLSLTKVAHTGHGLLRIGPLHRQPEKDDTITAFVKVACDAGMEAHYVDETSSFLWRKVLANAVINPLTAMFEISNGQLLESPQSLETMRMLFDEAKRVAKTEGQKISESDWQDILIICRNTSRNYSSMLQDLWNNKQTEIDAINGYISDLGKRNHVQTPMNDVVRRVVMLKTILRLQRGEAKNDVSQ